MRELFRCEETSQQPDQEVSIHAVQVIEFLPEVKKIQMHVARCTFCAQCVDACPVDALSESPGLLLFLTVSAYSGMREEPSDSGFVCATRRGIDLGGGCG
jgi:ferredoxin